jgi:hypothetical protein
MKRRENRERDKNNREKDHKDRDNRDNKDKDGNKDVNKEGGNIVVENVEPIVQEKKEVEQNLHALKDDAFAIFGDLVVPGSELISLKGKHNTTK